MVVPLIEDTKLSLEIVCEYLSDNMESKLIASFGLSAADFAPVKSSTIGTKRKADWEDALEVIIIVREHYCFTDIIGDIMLCAYGVHRSKAKR